MKKKSILLAPLLLVLTGCVHIVDGFQSHRATDLQAVLSFSHEFSSWGNDKRKRACKSLSTARTLKSDSLAGIKKASVVAIYPPCGRLSTAINRLEKAQVTITDVNFNYFIQYQIALLRQIQKERRSTFAYQQALRKLEEKNRVLQEKLEKIKSIEKTLKNRDN